MTIYGLKKIEIQSSLFMTINVIAKISYDKAEFFTIQMYIR